MSFPAILRRVVTITTMLLCHSKSESWSMIQRSTTIGPAAVILGALDRGMEIDDTLRREYGISPEDVRAAIGTGPGGSSPEEAI
jgi:hypothetical protein